MNDDNKNILLFVCILVGVIGVFGMFGCGIYASTLSEDNGQSVSIPTGSQNFYICAPVLSNPKDQLCTSWTPPSIPDWVYYTAVLFGMLTLFASIEAVRVDRTQTM